MLEVLLESRNDRTPRPIVEATISTLSHGALIVALVVGPKVARRLSKDAITPPEYAIPIDRAGPPHQEHIEFMVAATRGAPHELGGSKPSSLDKAAATSPNDQTVVAPLHAEMIDGAYSVLDVDSAAVRDPSSAAPSYPLVMKNLGIEGSATMRFVVDTTGRVDLGTVRTLDATNPAFASAVTEALPQMRFHPARMGAVLVRQAALEVFKFELKRKP